MFYPLANAQQRTSWANQIIIFPDTFEYLTHLLKCGGRGNTFTIDALIFFDFHYLYCGLSVMNVEKNDMLSDVRTLVIVYYR